MPERYKPQFINFSIQTFLKAGSTNSRMNWPLGLCMNENGEFSLSPTEASPALFIAQVLKSLIEAKVNTCILF